MRWIGEGLEHSAVLLDVLGTGVDGFDYNLIFFTNLCFQSYLTPPLKQPVDRARLTQFAAVAIEDATDLGRRAIAVIGERLDHDRHSGWAVPLVRHFLIVRPFSRAGGALDRTIDGIEGH